MPSDTSLSALLDLTRSLHWTGSRSEKTALINARSVLEILGYDRPADTLTREDIQDLVLRLRSAGNTGATINRKLAALNRMLNVAWTAGHISKPLHLSKMDEAQPRARFLTEEEQARLFAHLETEVRAFCIFLVETGAKAGEARALKWTEVRRESVRVGRTKRREVPLTAEAREALGRVSHHEKPWAHISPHKLTYAWRKAKEKAGLGADPEVVPLCLRHTFASRLMMATGDLLMLVKRLGLETLMMANRYAYLAPGSLELRRDALEQQHQEHHQ